MEIYDNTRDSTFMVHTSYYFGYRIIVFLFILSIFTIIIKHTFLVIKVFKTSFLNKKCCINSFLENFYIKRKIVVTFST